MLTKKITILSFVALTLGIQAQEIVTEKKGYKFNNNFDLALSTSGNQNAGALSWVHFHSVTKNQKFKIGYGLRFTAQSGNKLYYTTAPAILTSKETGPQVLFSKIYWENVDTFYVSHAQNNLLNISINLQYTLKNKLDIGFNIDAAGLSFGKKVNGKYISYQSSQSNSVHQASPTSANLLLVSDNDIGALNSELYARYWFKPKWAIKAGATFLFTEYTTHHKLRLDNDRWRNKVLMGMIGITYSPFR
jgi:hypothetical protein